MEFKNNELHNILNSLKGTREEEVLKQMQEHYSKIA